MNPKILPFLSSFFCVKLFIPWIIFYLRIIWCLIHAVILNTLPFVENAVNILIQLPLLSFRLLKNHFLCFFLFRNYFFQPAELCSQHFAISSVLKIYFQFFPSLLIYIKHVLSFYINFSLLDINLKNKQMLCWRYLICEIDWTFLCFMVSRLALISDLSVVSELYRLAEKKVISSILSLIFLGIKLCLSIILMSVLNWIFRIILSHLIFYQINMASEK